MKETQPEAKEKTTPKKGVSKKSTPKKNAFAGFDVILSLFKPSMPFQDKQDAARALTKAYLTAFILIAGVSIFIHFISSSITDIQKTSIANSYLITQERILVEQIYASASKHYSVGEELDLHLMKQAVENLAQSHQVIIEKVQAGSLFNPKSKVLEQIYFLPPYSLHDQITEYIENARSYANFDPFAEIEQRKESFEFLKRKGSSFLQTILNKALVDYQNEIISTIELFHYIQLGCLIIILALLVFEAVFIFHPLAFKTRTYHNMLLKQALQDPLTGLNNRRAFMNLAKTKMINSPKEDDDQRRNNNDTNTLIVALTDLDHFKSVNDEYGHDVGDAVLKYFASVLKTSLRSDDVTGRIGGEEFAIVLPRTDFKTGKDILERLCKDVANTPCPYVSEDGNNEVLSYTVSIGFTVFEPNDKIHMEDLLKEADEALYNAKQAGRNRVMYAKNSK